jgi:hypothetical protein
LGINATRFGSDVYPDADSLNRLVDNDKWLADVMPRIRIRYPNGKVVATSSNDQTRIFAGMFPLPKKFKGISDVYEIKMPSAADPGPPIITLTTQSRYPTFAFITGWTPGYRAAKVRVVALDKTKQTSAILYWHSVQGV